MDHALHTPITLTEPKARRPFWRTIRTAVTLWSERRELSRLDDRMLHDIGLTREDMLQEAGRAPWDIPRDRDV